MWGNSPPLDFRHEISTSSINLHEIKSLEILTMGTSDARHIIKTLSSLHEFPDSFIHFHVFESNAEHIARSILLLNIYLLKDLGLQEASRYYLELLGNTLLTPGTAKFLIKIINQLIDIITQSIPCQWLNLDYLKYKERDLIEAIFKFWARAVCEGVPIVEYWDRRVRKALGRRYDYRDGVFDWDFQMVLKSRNIPYLTVQEYKFWRNNGIAFTWLETEPSRNNPTLISNIIPKGEGYLHYAYTGDITNGPYLTWALDGVDIKEKLRASDKAESQIMKAIYQMRNGKSCPDSVIAAHRDQSVLNGTLVTEMPDIDIEQECWTTNKHNFVKSKVSWSWIDLPRAKVNFHSISNFVKYKNKDDWRNKIDIVFVANNMLNQLVNIVDLMKKGAILIVESRRFLVEFRKEEQGKFVEELTKITEACGLKALGRFNPQDDDFARFVKE